jgi:hypothetical protein
MIQVDHAFATPYWAGHALWNWGEGFHLVRRELELKTRNVSCLNMFLKALLTNSVRDGGFPSAPAIADSRFSLTGKQFEATSALI